MVVRIHTQEVRSSSLRAPTIVFNELGVVGNSRVARCPHGCPHRLGFTTAERSRGPPQFLGAMCSCSLSEHPLQYFFSTGWQSEAQPPVLPIPELASWVSVLLGRSQLLRCVPDSLQGDAVGIVDCLASLTKTERGWG